MDLSTIEAKLQASGPKGKSSKKGMGKYKVKDEVMEDFRRVWGNSDRFNGREHAVSQAGRALEEVFEKSLTEVPADEEVSLFSFSPLSFHLLLKREEDSFVLTRFLFLWVNLPGQTADSQARTVLFCLALPRCPRPRRRLAPRIPRIPTEARRAPAAAQGRLGPCWATEVRWEEGQVRRAVSVLEEGD